MGQTCCSAEGSKRHTLPDTSPRQTGNRQSQQGLLSTSREEGLATPLTPLQTTPSMAKLNYFSNPYGSGDIYHPCQLNWIISEKFLRHPKYENLRRTVEEEARGIEGIEDVLFDMNVFMIQCVDPHALKKAESVLEIVAWRFFVTGAWNLDSDTAYDNLFKTTGIDDKGIWDIIPMDRFVRKFIGYDEEEQANVLERVPQISNDDFEYLYDNEHVDKSNGTAFEDLKSKLTHLREIQIYEVVLVGQRAHVERLILAIRKHEIENAKINFEEEEKRNPFMKLKNRESDLINTPLFLYEATIDNIPKDVEDVDLLNFLSEYASVLTCRILENPTDKHINARIDFDSEEERQKLLAKIESEEGLVFREGKLEMVCHEVITRKRKIRRVSSRHKMY